MFFIDKLSAHSHRNMGQKYGTTKTTGGMRVTYTWEKKVFYVPPMWDIYASGSLTARAYYTYTNTQMALSLVRGTLNY